MRCEQLLRTPIGLLRLVEEQGAILQIQPGVECADPSVRHSTPLLRRPPARSRPTSQAGSDNSTCRSPRTEPPGSNGLGGNPRDPLRNNGDLRRGSCPHRESAGSPQRGRSRTPQSDSDRDSVPPHRRCRRIAHGLCRRSCGQKPSARTRTTGGPAVVIHRPRRPDDTHTKRDEAFRFVPSPYSSAPHGACDPYSTARTYPCRHRRAGMPNHRAATRRRFRERCRCQDHRQPDRRCSHYGTTILFHGFKDFTILLK